MECIHHDKFNEIENLKREKRLNNKTVQFYPIYNRKLDRFEDVFGNPIKNDPTQIK